MSASVIDLDGKPVADAVIYLDAPGAVLLAVPDATQAQAQIDQVNKEFVPRVIAVRSGGRVAFPNHDDIRHHVYSFSVARNFELPLYRGTPASPVDFPKSGVVTLGCNIHDWMRGYILVLDTPYFANSDETGAARIEAVPAGAWRAMLWHPDLAQQEPLAGSMLDIAADPVAVEFRVELTPRLKIRRAPAVRRDDRY